MMMMMKNTKRVVGMLVMMSRVASPFQAYARSTRLSFVRSLNTRKSSSSWNNLSTIPRHSSIRSSRSNDVQPPSNAEQSSTKNPPPRAKTTTSKTGGLRRLPVVKSPVELAAKASKTVRWIKPDASIQNAKNRARKHGAETMNALSQALCLPLRDIVQGYKTEWRRLHPFERVVADLTARAREKRDGLTLFVLLDEIHEARKMILEIGKDWIYKIKNAETAREAGQAMEEGMDAMMNLFDQVAAPPVAGLLELQRSLRSAPIVELDTPAVVLVGAPNVGKSSIVRCISSGRPEVNNYPFTTRGMTLGHVQVFWSDHASVAGAVVPSIDDDDDAYDGREELKLDSMAETGSSSSSSKGANATTTTTSVITGRYAFSQLCQVMDSPGLLVRPDDERNEMEALTLAAMQHLPTAVMYVMDLSGEAGDKCSSIKDQLLLRKEIRARFPRRPWIDVVSKVDLGIVDGALEELEEILDGAPYIQLSIHDNIGVAELRTRVLHMLEEVKLVLDAMAAQETRV